MNAWKHETIQKKLSCSVACITQTDAYQESFSQLACPNPVPNDGAHAFARGHVLLLAVQKHAVAVERAARGHRRLALHAVLKTVATRRTEGVDGRFRRRRK